MPLFISDAELEAAGADVALVVERADGHIRDLLQQLEAHDARADAAAITAEQRSAIVEQKFLAMSSQFRHMENQIKQLENSLERRSEDLTHSQAQVHKLELESMKQDNDRERVSCELNEMRKARSELLDVVEQKNADLIEKNVRIKTYLDKIVLLTDERSNLEGKVREAEAEMTRSHAVQARLSQEKELMKQHNLWLNDELTDKADTLLKERRASADVEVELRSKLARAEQLCKETGESLQKRKEQVKDLELRLNETREELRFTKEDAARKEGHFSVEVETASKLADLYKKSSDEWSKKAIDLEGAIKALEVHLNQVEAESKECLEKEVKERKTSEKNAMAAKEKMVKLEKELELSKKGEEKESLFLIGNSLDAAPKDLDISDQELSLELHDDGPLLPVVPTGISGTALAAALLRDGWNITKIYIKYQEVVDAWRHEKQERRQSQAILQRVFQEIEQRAEMILDERAEHAHMVEAYAVMEEKLQVSFEEQSSLENQIRELKADLRKRERDLNGVKQECSDLQSQVVVLLKECADIKQRSGGENFQLKGAFGGLVSTQAMTASDAVISERLLTFKNIHEVVEQNSQLHAIVRSLSHQNEECEMELKETFDLELKKRTDEAAQKVSTILRKSEEQTQLIASLQGTVGMYRRLYEEEVKSRSMILKDNGIITAAGTSGEDVRSLIVRSQEDTEKVCKEASERMSMLEDDLNKARQDVSVARMEIDRLVVEAAYAREQRQTIVKDSDNQKKEMDEVLSKNVEFSQIITDYKRRLRENAEHVQSVEEKSRRLSVEVSVLEREKELISIAERRASQELSSVSDHVHQLQATLDNIHTVEEAQESMRVAEKKKLEEEVNRMQKEWVEMKHELDLERVHTRQLSSERHQVVKRTMDQIESISEELADALQRVSVSETRAHVAEDRCTMLEANLKKAEEKILLISSTRKLGNNSKDINLELDTEARQEVDRLKEELDASKKHTDQYKCLAQLNEEALIQMEDAHNYFKEEAEKTKESLGSELSCLREKATGLEKRLSEREIELVAAEAQKERAISTAEKEIVLLRESYSEKRILLEQAEERIKALKDELEKEHQLWRSAQSNYERQVLLQADTILELTLVSERNGSLEKEVLELQAKAEISRTELGSSRVAWEMEKSSLLSENESLISKIRELEEQNQILLDRVEATHILAADHNQKPVDLLKSSEHVETDLQDVIRYLRRSKETSDLEISLLKQERIRLQKQLESALHAAEEAQANLRSEHENSRATLCSEEEFKSLQVQVREMTLLRESNTQLRLENKRNFEDCQSLREKLQNEQAEVESLRKSLTEREVELEATVKDVDLQKAEIARWESRVSQLLLKYKSLDMEEYNRAQSQLASTQESLRLQQVELDAAKGEPQKLQEVIHNLEQEILIKDEKITGLEKRVKEAEGTAKAETEKSRKQMFLFKRKIETITKEKDDMKDSFLKQLDELKASANKRGLRESSHRSEAQIRQEMATQHEQVQKENENLLKEKETRIQTLERTLEREREDLKKEREELRKEKQRRMNDQRTYYDFTQKQDMSQDKQKLVEELSALKREKDNFSENIQAKKFGRRIVRPKIESPVESQIQLEASELGKETTIEVSEAEAEIRDDTKLALTYVTEVPENLSTTSAIVVASTFSAPSTDDVVTGVRKRPSTQAHDFMEESSCEQSTKNEEASAHKKQKGLDLKAIVVVSNTIPMVITESCVTVEASKVMEMDVEHATAGDSETFDRNDLSTLAKTEVHQMVDVIENDQGIHPSVQIDQGIHPSVQIDPVATKRPRIVRSNAFHPPGSQSDDAIINIQNEKTITSEAETLPDSTLTGERDERSLVPVEEHLHYNSQVPHSSPQRTENSVGSTEPHLRNPFHPTVVNAPDIPSLQSLSQETFLAFEREGTQNLLVDLNDATDISVDSGSIPTSLEPEVTITLAVERITETGTSMEVSFPKAVETAIITDAPLTDSGLEVEDGEIEPDDPEDSFAECVPQEMSMDVSIEDKNSGSLSLGAVEKDAQHSDGTLGDKKLPLNNEPPQTRDIGALEGSQADQGTHSENARSQVVPRQARKNTTIILSERAKERSLARRSGMLPLSPGRRNPRSFKTSVGVQRGQANPPDVEPEAAGGEEGKRRGAHQSGPQSAPTANKFDALREEE